MQMMTFSASRKALAWKPLRLGWKFLTLYLAINLNLVLILYLLFIWGNERLRPLKNALGEFYFLVNFWDSTFCFWENSFLNLTFTEPVRAFSFRFVDATHVRWDQYVLLYKEFFLSLYGGLFYFTVGTLIGVVRSGITRWRSMRKDSTRDVIHSNTG